MHPMPCYYCSFISIMLILDRMDLEHTISPFFLLFFEFLSYKTFGFQEFFASKIICSHSVYNAALEMQFYTSLQFFRGAIPAHTRYEGSNFTVHLSNTFYLNRVTSIAYHDNSLSCCFFVD